VPWCPSRAIEGANRAACAGACAGHETTGATLASLLPELQRQPRILARMREEQATVVQRFGEAITCARPLIPLCQACYAPPMLQHVGGPMLLYK
jgi:hypothetical protein